MTVNDREHLKIPSTWKQDPVSNAITREFVFADFMQAFSFITHVALLAERDCHHPEWTNIYNQVSIRLTTHDQGRVTQRDVDMARHIDGVFSRIEAG